MTGLRFLGVDDGAFSKTDKSVIVIGVVTRGNSVVEAVLSDSVAVDGDDATEKIIALARKAPRLHAVFLNGIALAGFNAVDINAAARSLHVPVIAIVRKKPEMESIERALAKVAGGAKKLETIRAAGRLFKDGVFFQAAGATPGEARELMQAASQRAKVPECLRLAHLIASGVTMGESTGRA
jgi:endonuclease V-like protein UPF0215 family